MKLKAITSAYVRMRNSIIVCALALATTQVSAQSVSDATLNLTASVAGVYGLRGDKNIDLLIEPNGQSEFTERNALSFFSNKIGNYRVSIRSKNGGLISGDNNLAYSVSLVQGTGSWGSFSAVTVNSCHFSDTDAKMCPAMLISSSTSGEIKPAIDGNITAKINVNINGGNAVALNELYHDILTLSVAEDKGSML